MSQCGETITIEGRTLTCEVRGHTRPHHLGPTHRVVDEIDGKRVVVRWPTQPDIEEGMKAL